MAKYNESETKKVQFNKKTKKLELLEVPKMTALYYYQFLKLLTELEDNGYKLVTEKKRRVKSKGDSSKGIYKSSGYVLNEKVKIDKSAFKSVDLDWVRKQPKILNMKEDVFASLSNNTSKSKKYFQNSSFKFFEKHKHLFLKPVTNLIESQEDLHDKDYMCIKIPIHMRDKNKNIEEHIKLIVKNNKFEGESPTSRFERILANKDYDRYLRAFILRERYDMSYKDLLGALGYTHNPNSEGRTTMKSPQRAVLKSKYLLYNLMTENVFPKTTLD